jgi:hypothetical protein
VTFRRTYRLHPQGSLGREDHSCVTVESLLISLSMRHTVYCPRRQCGRLINSNSMAIQLWGPATLRNPEDGGDIFSETSLLTRATRYKVPEDIYTKFLGVPVRPRSDGTKERIPITSYHVTFAIHGLYENHSRSSYLQRFTVYDCRTIPRQSFQLIPRCHHITRAQMPTTRSLVLYIRPYAQEHTWDRYSSKSVICNLDFFTRGT